MRIGVDSLLEGYNTLKLKSCYYISESSDRIKC